MISRSEVAVLSISAVIGAASAVVAVAGYRGLINREVPISVPSKLNEQRD